MDIAELRKNIEGELNPSLVATEMGFFTSSALKNNKLSIYEALYLKDLEYSLFLQACEKPAWDYKVGVSLLLSLELLYSLALYFDEAELSISIKDKIAFALSNLNEARPHHSREVARLILSGDTSSALLILSRSRREPQPFEEGPYNDEVFPWEFLSPEEEVLSRNYGTQKSISSDIADLISEVWVNNG